MKNWRVILLVLLLTLAVSGLGDRLGDAGQKIAVLPGPPKVSTGPAPPEAATPPLPRTKEPQAVSPSAHAFNLASALKGIGTTAATITMPPGISELSSDLAIPANIALRIDKGSIIRIPHGCTLQINGPLEAGPYQIFSCTGSGKVTFGPGSGKALLIRWWGARGNGTTDDTTAVQSAFDACAGGFPAEIHGSPGDVYLVGTLSFKALRHPSGVHTIRRICGKGAILKQKALDMVLRISGSSSRIVIDEWSFMGSMSFVWKCSDLGFTPTELFFNDTKGQKKDSLHALTTDKDWYYDKSSNILYTFLWTKATEKPSNRFKNIRADSKPIDLTRFFSGDAIYINTSLVTVENCAIRYFDKALHFVYGLSNSVRDCNILYVNNAIYGEEDKVGKSHHNIFEHLNIAGTYEDAVYYRNAREIKLAHCSIEITWKRVIHMERCSGVTLNQIDTEWVCFGGYVSEALLFESCSAISITNGAFWGRAETHTMSSYFRFTKNTEGVNLEANAIIPDDSKTTKLYLYSTDNTCSGITFRNNSFRSMPVKWSKDIYPAVLCENNAFYDPSWITLMPSLLKQAPPSVTHNLPNYSTVNPTFALPLTTAPLRLDYHHATSVIDSTSGSDDSHSWKISWQGPDARVSLDNWLLIPEKPGTYWPVITLFYKSDTQQRLKIVHAATYREIPVYNDNQWRCLVLLSPSRTFPGGVVSYGLTIETDATLGNLWIDNVSCYWFPSFMEASAWVGSLAAPPSESGNKK
jgi:hypothetical protein